MIPSLQLMVVQCPPIKQNLVKHNYHQNIIVISACLEYHKIFTKNPHNFTTCSLIHNNTACRPIYLLFHLGWGSFFKISYKDVCSVAFLTYPRKLSIFLFWRVSLNSKKSIDVIKTSRHDSARGVSKVECMSQLV